MFLSFIKIYILYVSCLYNSVKLFLCYLTLSHNKQNFRQITSASSKNLVCKSCKNGKNSLCFDKQYRTQPFPIIPSNPLIERFFLILQSLFELNCSLSCRFFDLFEPAMYLLSKLEIIIRVLSLLEMQVLWFFKFLQVL